MHINKITTKAAIFAGTAIIMFACNESCNNMESTLTNKTTTNMEKLKGFTTDIEKATNA